MLINCSIHKALELCKSEGHAFYSDGTHLNGDGIAHMCIAFVAHVLTTGGSFEHALVPIIRL